MILGIGTDIVKIERLEKALERTGERFAARILTPSEMTAFASAPRPAAFLAKRFAAKEAAAKALGTGIAQGVSWQHMEITNDALGAPQLQLSLRALEIQREKGAIRVDLSLADEQDYVVAFVTLSG